MHYAATRNATHIDVIARHDDVRRPLAEHTLRTATQERRAIVFERDIGAAMLLARIDAAHRLELPALPHTHGGAAGGDARTPDVDRTRSTTRDDADAIEAFDVATHTVVVGRSSLTRIDDASRRRSTAATATAAAAAAALHDLPPMLQQLAIDCRAGGGDVIACLARRERRRRRRNIAVDNDDKHDSYKNDEDEDAKIYSAPLHESLVVVRRGDRPDAPVNDDDDVDLAASIEARKRQAIVPGSESMPTQVPVPKVLSTCMATVSSKFVSSSFCCCRF